VPHFGRLASPGSVWAAQQRLFENTARNIAGVSEHIVQKHIAHCTQADPAYGKGVADAIARQKAGTL
jgi:catalase